MKKATVLFILLLIVFSQVILLTPHLKYGFSDVDWGFLLIYKTHNPYSVNQFLDFLKTGGTLGGVYTHQIYYMGIIYDLFGLDYQKFALVTNIFKILATLAAFPFFYILTKNTLATFLGTLLFAFSYPTVGTMYTISTSSDYSAILFFNLFLFSYFYIIFHKKSNIKYLLLCLSLFLATLFLSTERTNPVIFIIIITEACLLIIHKFSKDYVKDFLKRILFFLSPVVLFLLFFPNVALGFVGGNGKLLLESILKGDLTLLLRPFISLGSIIIPFDHWRYFGVYNPKGFISFIEYFIFGPLAIFIIISSSLGLIIFKKTLQFILQIISLTFFCGILTYISYIKHISHLDTSFITPALIGEYITLFGVISFLHWWKYQRQEKRLFGIFVGIFSSLVFIIITWIGADNQLIFTGVHRYLTIPALFICLSLGCLFSLIISNIYFGNRVVKPLVILPILLLITTIIIWSGQINYFFQDELKNGFGADDKKLMRDQLLAQTKDLSNNEPSLFYFDFSEDPNRGYYYDNVLLAGFSSWMSWHPRIDFNENIKPYVFWNDFKRLQSSKAVQNNQQGFQINDRFYSIDDFYAFKLKDQVVTDIKGDILKYLNSSQ